MVGGGIDYSAAFQRAIELIGKRWTGAVVKALLPGPARFNQLLAGIPGISDRVLTERLRELETEGIVERLCRVAIGDCLRRRPEGQTCRACGSPLPHGAVCCPSCGVKTDDPQAEPLHIVDRTTGLFNDRFVRPVLEDELARAHRYQRNLGVLLIEANGTGSADEALKLMAAALAGTVRDVDTPGVLGRTPPQLLAILPDTDVAGTAHAANRVLSAVNEALKQQGTQAAVGLVAVRPGRRVRAGAVIDSASRSLRSGRPEMMGKPA